MIDYISISALIISGISGVASLHLYRVKICGNCIESDCWKEVSRRSTSKLTPMAIEEEPLIK